MVFSQRLSELLDKHSVTWKEVSNSLKIGKNQRKLWEDKNTAPDGETLVKLCRYFNVSADYLLGLSDESPNEGIAILVRAFKESDTEGQYRIVQFCLNILDTAEERRVREEGQA